MPQTKYLLIGASHAALEALRAIRQHDPDGPMAMLSRERHLPYSPTLLPYVVSARTSPDRVALRDRAFFDASGCVFVAGAEARAVDPQARRVRLADGTEWRYERALIATGATPAMPPVAGLAEVPHHVLRTLDDARALRDAIAGRRSAVVLGAGLVGLHAAEILAAAGLAVTVVEQRSHVLADYFAEAAAPRIAAAFIEHGIALRLGGAVAEAARAGLGCRLRLADGDTVAADLLIVAAGVRPAVGWLDGCGVAIDRGVLVDRAMRTSAEGLWAAGDVAQAPDFHSGAARLCGILPAAVEQGGIAGMSMAGDPYLRPYRGAVPINTFRFFGRVALSVGQSAAGPGVTVAERCDGGYRRILVDGGRLVGMASVDAAFDPGVMVELIRRRVDLGDRLDALLARPVETGRRLMSELWS